MAIKKFDKYTYEEINMSVFNLQVCSNCPVDESDKLEKAVQEHSPAGTENNWQIELKGNLAPVKCADNINRYHYVFSC